MDIVIIGNGDCFFPNSGKIINSFDRNIRFNYFVIDGYEEKVGNKIDIICVHNDVFSALDINVFKHYMFCNEIWIPFIKESVKKDNNYNILKDKIKTITNNDIQYFYDVINEERIVRRYFSTGFWCIKMAMYFGYNNIYIIGFDWSKTRHYFLYKRDQINHPWEYEKKQIYRLIYEKKIKMLMQNINIFLKI